MKFGRTILALAILAVGGCHRGSEQVLAPTESRLVNLAAAYTNAASHLKRAPKSMAEIQPYLEVGGEDIARSPNDGEKFVVLWGIDYAKLPPRRENPYTVMAYEKNGAGGKRFVLRYPTRVALMTDAELSQAEFPPGHHPPK
jgi:hypothetical protein